MFNRLLFAVMLTFFHSLAAHAQIPFLVDKGGATTGDGNIYQSAGTGRGLIGIGTSTPRQTLEVLGPIITGGVYNSDMMFVGNDWLSFNYDPTSNKIFNPNAYSFVFSHNTNAMAGLAGVNPNEGLYLQIKKPTGEYVSYAAMAFLSNGNVGIGVGTPGADLSTLPHPPAASTPILEVGGDIALSQGRGGSVYFQDGSIQRIAWDGTTMGQDYAEEVDVLGDRKSYEPGDVMVIDSKVAGRFVRSDVAYSHLVAGVFSTKPGLLGKNANVPRSDRAAEVPMAMMGMVPTKLSAENGPIEPGDLLVSSHTPGYAMKGTDRDRLIGAVIGKALGSLKSGTGLVQVLISVQ